MDFILPALMMMTLLAAIIFAMWSQKRTEESLEGRETQHSLLSRDEPDPNFLPDPKITDPHNVSGRGQSPSHMRPSDLSPDKPRRGSEYDQPETRKTERSADDATDDQQHAEKPSDESKSS